MSDDDDDSTISVHDIAMRAIGPILHLQKIIQASRLPDAVSRIQEQFRNYDALVKPRLVEFAEGTQLALRSSGLFDAAVGIQKMLETPAALATIQSIANVAERLRQNPEFNDKLKELLSSADLEEFDYSALGAVNSTAAIDPLDDEALDELRIPDEHREALVRVERLPLALVQEVLKDPRHMLRLNPREFEFFIAELLEKLGFSDVMVTPRSGDEGRDVLAKKLVDRIPLLFMFECKRYERSKKVRIETIRSLLGAASVRTANVNKAILVTTSTFTRGGWNLMASEARLGGRDYDGLIEWISDLRGISPRDLVDTESPDRLKAAKQPSRRNKRPEGK